MFTVAVMNNKGGVAKTTTTVSLGAALARSGHKTLVVDLDAQCSASICLGVPRADLKSSDLRSSASALLEGRRLDECVRATDTPNLFLVPGGKSLASADLVLADERGRERKLRAATAGLDQGYEFVLLDCPPSLGLIVINALVASDGFLVPITPDPLALEGLVDMLDAVERIRGGIGASTKLLGILVTLADYREAVTTEMVGLLREHYGAGICGTEIRKSVRLREAPSHGRHIFDYAPASSGAESYKMLARELIGRCRHDGKVDGRKGVKKERRVA
jgi:chromosome partitioning protein